MWRSKKFIIITLLTATVLVGSIGGVAFAQTEDEDNSQPKAQCGMVLDRVCEIYNANPDRPSDIDSDILKTAFAEARSEMQGEMPDRIRAQVARGARISECLVDNFGIDLDSLKAAMAEARERIQAGEDREVVMAEVLAEFGIDIEELKATCGVDDGERPFRRFRGMGGIRGFGGPCTTAE